MPPTTSALLLAETRTLPRDPDRRPAARRRANGFYLSRALLAEAEDGADFDVRIVTGAAFAAMPADRSREQSVIMMLSTHGLDRRVGETLRGFLDGGGGLFIAAGPDVDPVGRLDAAGLAAARWRRATCATPACSPPPISAIPSSVRSTPWPRTSDRSCSSRAWQVDAGSPGASSRAITNGGTALAERRRRRRARAALHLGCRSQVERLPAESRRSCRSRRKSRAISAPGRRRCPPISSRTSPAGVAPRTGGLVPGRKGRDARHQRRPA